ncbi:MAG: hypothetical protein IJY69_04885 [Clostridia bacterium]|nr:hypothetical protein [Clostridia bacterium]
MRKKVINEVERIYGRLPKKPKHLYLEIIKEEEYGCGDGKLYYEHKITAEYDKGFFSFNIRSIMPADTQRCILIYVGCDKKSTVSTTPCEKIANIGYRTVSLCLKELFDKSHDKSSLVKLACNRQKKGIPGRLMLCAYAAGLVADCIRYEHPGRPIYIVGDCAMGEAVILGAVMAENIDVCLINEEPLCEESPDLYCREYNSEYTVEERIEILKGAVRDKIVIYRDNDLSAALQEVNSENMCAQKSYC